MQTKKYFLEVKKCWRYKKVSRGFGRREYRDELKNKNLNVVRKTLPELLLFEPFFSLSCLFFPHILSYSFEYPSPFVTFDMVQLLLKLHQQPISLQDPVNNQVAF